MKDKILVVDDNKDLLFNLKILFELNDFDAITAINGKDALRVLFDEHIIPSVIVCDIMMPEMDGYEFFRVISSDPILNSIPFIFLTAKSSSDDVRFGKLLGIDDYLTKPFNEEDLLSIVKGKIVKRKKINAINSHFAINLSNLESYEKRISKIKSYKDAIIFLVLWDEMTGPSLLNYYPLSTTSTKSQLERIGTQLFQSSVSIFGFQDDVSRESLLLSIKNIEKKGFLLFDSYEDADVRGGRRLFMIGLINDEISYYDSLIIEKTFNDLASNFIKNKIIDIEKAFSSIIKNGKLFIDEM